MGKPDNKSKLISDLSIKRKLILVVAASSVVSAFVIGGALFSFQIYNQREQFRANVVSVSEVIMSYVSVPVADDDQKAAEEVLSALKTNSNIVRAQIRFRSGEVFAVFGDDSPLERTFPEVELTEFDGWSLYVTRGVLVPNKSYVWLIVEADFKSVFFSTALSMGLAILGVVCAGFVVATITTASFRNVIIGPIIQLASTARQVAEERDYGLRATVFGQDEVGKLTSNFNDMLSRIQDSDMEVRNAYSKLELESSERERLQDDLLKASRMAGMAEVATGVLHNVGNVLNTVNLSVQHLQEQLGESRLNHLRSALELIQAQNGNLGEFFTSDPKGKVIPEFMSKVTAHLEDENSTMRSEVTQLIGHVDHIKEIVSTQQSYARVLGVSESLPAEDLIKDALKLSSDTLSKHHIEITEQFDSVPEVVVDRHKVVQILVNLLTNAKDAMSEVDPSSRAIIIRINRGEPGFVRISVKDSGIGIKAESLPSIFNHGYTTKVNGHGFGLHLSALNAQEMGGSMTVDSEGEGLGATFTLIVPTESQSQPE